jgi:hypothetical protein
VSSARAQDASTIEEAREAFEVGSALVARGELARGIAELERSLTLFPYLPSAFNLSVAYARGDEPLRAAELLSSILDGRFGTLAPERRAEVTRTLRDVERSLAVIEVELIGGREGWAQLDDEPPMPLRDRGILRVLPGSVVVTVGSDGETPQRTALRLEAGDRERLRLVAGAERGTLTVRGPNDVEIVDVARGTSPLRRELAPGTYEVGRVGDPESRRRVAVLANATREVDLGTASTPVRRRRRAWAVGVSLVVAAAAAGLAIALTRGRAEDDSVFVTFYALR